MTPPCPARIGLALPIFLIPSHFPALPEHRTCIRTPSCSPLHSLSASRPTLLNPILTPCCPGAWRRLIQLLSGWIAAQRRRPGRPSSTRSFEASTCRTPRHARSGPRPPTAPARSHQVAFLCGLLLLAPPATNAVATNALPHFWRRARVRPHSHSWWAALPRVRCVPTAFSSVGPRVRSRSAGGRSSWA